MWLDDVLEQEFMASQFENFDFFERQSQVGVAIHGSDGGDFFELLENVRRADIAGVDDVFYAFKKFGDFWVEIIMGIGDYAYFHVLQRMAIVRIGFRDMWN